MKFKVNEVEFDFDYEQTYEDERIEITNDHLGVWEADDADDLIEKITANSSWCIKSINYQVQHVNN
tara:strand:+ start:246 stop:443 length:198 start_codon:yes stop_codon:yes gene_type:complete